MSVPAANTSGSPPLIDGAVAQWAQRLRGLYDAYGCGILTKDAAEVIGRHAARHGWRPDIVEEILADLGDSERRITYGQLKREYIRRTSRARPDSAEHCDRCADAGRVWLVSGTAQPGARKVYYHPAQRTWLADDLPDDWQPQTVDSGGAPCPHCDRGERIQRREDRGEFGPWPPRLIALAARIGLPIRDADAVVRGLEAARALPVTEAPPKKLAAPLATADQARIVAMAVPPPDRDWDF